MRCNVIVVMKKLFKQFTAHAKLLTFALATTTLVALLYVSPTPASALCKITGAGFPSVINSFSVNLSANDILSVDGNFKKGGECMQNGMFREGVPSVAILNTNLISGPTTISCATNCIYQPQIDVSSLQSGTYQATFSVDDQWGGAVPKSATFSIKRAAPAAMPTTSLSITPLSVRSGDRATLTWASTNATSCTAGGLWSNAGKLSGSGLTNPIISNTTFTLLCSGPGGVSPLQSVTVAIFNGTPITSFEVPPAPLVRISASPAIIANSGSTNIVWLATGATQGCVASGAWSGAQQESGAFKTPTLSPGTYTYTLSCTGNLGRTTSANAKVLVLKGKTIPPPVPLPTPPAPVVKIYASPVNVRSGDSVVITWSASDATQGCNAYGDWSGAKQESGAFQTGPLSAGTYNYSLSCTGSLGRMGSGNAQVIVATAAPTVSIAALPSSLVVGNPATLIWASTNTTSCNASGSWSGVKATSGSEKISPFAAAGSYGYTLTCTGPGGAANNSTNIIVSLIPSCNNGANNPPVCTTCSATQVWDAASSSCIAPPAFSVSLSAATTSCRIAGPSSCTSTTIVWNTDVPASSKVQYSTSPTFAAPLIEGNIIMTTAHAVSLIKLIPATSYYYKVQSTDAYSQEATDDNKGKYYTFSTPVCPIQNILLAPVVSTNAATAISQATTTLNGYVDPNNTSDTLHWFNWGTSTASLINETPRILQESFARNFLEIISNLAKGTNYYFQAMARNAQGLATGGIESFTTPKSEVIVPPPLPLPSSLTPVITIGASSLLVTNGDPVVITWSVDKATQGCIASGDWSGQMLPSGSFTTGRLANGTYIYTLTCSDGAGLTSSRSITVMSGTGIGAGTGGALAGGNSVPNSGTIGTVATTTTGTTIGGAEQFVGLGVGVVDIGAGSVAGEGNAIQNETTPINQDKVPFIEQLQKAIISTIPDNAKEALNRTILLATKAIAVAKQEIIAFTDTPVGAIATQTVAATGVVGGSAITVATVSSNAATFSDLALTIFRIWNVILVALGLRKKRVPWGTVYDSVTKQPLDPAYVVLEDQAGKEAGTAITDLDGRFGFLVPPGSYRLTANKTNYTFPSKKLTGKDHDDVYDNLYFSGDVSLAANELMIKNIPMDPEAFDWNEFAKRDKKLMMFYSRNTRVVTKITTLLFYAGLCTTAVLYLARPDALNLSIVIIYGVLLVLRFLGLKPKSYGLITEANTKEPLSFAIIRVFQKGVTRELFHRVSDQYGRYYALLSKGEYYVTIERKNPDETYTLVHTSQTIDAKKGIINQNFSI